jgi:UPF0755 protein
MEKLIRFPAGLFLLLLLSGCSLYESYMVPNTQIPPGSDGAIYIKTTDTFEDVLAQLSTKNLLIRPDQFETVARQRGYAEAIRPGKYLIEAGKTNIELVNQLKGGRQVPVRISFHQIANVEAIASKVSPKIEMDSADFVSLIKNPDWTAENLEMSPIEASTIFIPDTYEMYWGTDAAAFIKRMKKAYDTFWNEDRRGKAESLNLSPFQVSVLASIVQMEQAKISDEWPTIAGLYLNRLRRGMRLEADPTVKFAWGDMSIQRVLNRHLEIESPYNTYKVHGLPPSPLYLPEPGAIDAVLNPESHNYIFMCAHYNMSGRHIFTSSLSEHNRNAMRFHQELNRRRIY